MSQENIKKRRLDDTTIACPIVFGSIAFWMGKKAEEHASHRWTLFVRGPNDEDLSCFVSKIIFSLHPSFATPLREITSAPFEVTEMGWGEFEAGIRVFFKDPDEKPVDILHMIRLYSDGAGPQSPSKKPVVKEFYDEIVFTTPTPSFRAMLMQYVPPVPRPITWLTEHYTVFNEETDLQKLMVVQDYLAQQIDAAKSKLLRQESELGYLQAVQSSVSSSASAVSHGTSSSSSNAQVTSTSSNSTHQQGSASGSTAKKKEGKAEKAERERLEREKAERDRVAANKKRAANAKAKKEKAEKLLKAKAAAAAASSTTTTSTANTTVPTSATVSTNSTTTATPNAPVSNTTS